MLTTDKESCNLLVSLLVSHGIKNAVVSPGSRNAPILVALSSCDEIKKTIVVDERSAAFMALGMSTILDEPVALVCTSGTALLNYAPAVAEAYYRKIPLVIISADRPNEWIDQDDSQTIRQYECLSHYVKRSYDIPARCNADAEIWYANRMINDALLLAKSGRKAPVHINMQLDEPLGRLEERLPTQTRVIETFMPQTNLSAVQISELAKKICSTRKVMVVAGFMAPNENLNRALMQLSQQENIIVLHENVSNLHGEKFIATIDRTLSTMTDADLERMRPEVVITMGGAIISRFVKRYLRKYRSEHWHVGITENTIDCFQSLTLKIETNPEAFFTDLAGCMPAGCCVKSRYAELWRGFERQALISHVQYLNAIGWSDLKAFSLIMDKIPDGWNLQFSNGTSIRYAQLFDYKVYHRCDCNRGVSGIDGCTSTAIGASLAYDGVTLLVSGDMSAQYDIGALANKDIPSRFKMIVMCNGGGGIFRFIDSTSSLPQREEYFAVQRTFPIKNIAEGYGFSYYEAHDEQSLSLVLPQFMSAGGAPAILAIHTPAMASAEILRGYFKRGK